MNSFGPEGAFRLVIFLGSLSSVEASFFEEILREFKDYPPSIFDDEQVPSSIYPSISLGNVGCV